MTTSGNTEREGTPPTSAKSGDGLYEAIDLLQDVFRAIASEAPGNARSGREAFSHIVRLPEDAAPVTSFQLGELVQRVAAKARPSAASPAATPLLS